MGSPLAPNYANIFMADLEERILSSYPKGEAPPPYFGNVILMIFMSFGTMESWTRQTPRVLHSYELVT